jgi:cytoskeletal protein CcmA (bactofilin family)
MPTPQETCVIGRGIRIDGRLTGDEDLIVEGHIEGTITLNNHLVIEETGTVVANVEAVELTIRGRLNGNIVARELISILAGAVVIGDIRAPRILIEDGARFKGNIEMDVPLPPGVQA